MTNRNVPNFDAKTDDFSVCLSENDAASLRESSYELVDYLRYSQILLVLFTCVWICRSTRGQKPMRRASKQNILKAVSSSKISQLESY